MSNGIIEYLNSLGYSFKPAHKGNTFKSHAQYRGGDNKNSLHICVDKMVYYDFVAGCGGSIKKLIALTLNKDIEVVDELLKDKTFYYQTKIYDSFEIERPKLYHPKVYSESFLSRLSRDDTYWNNRGISSDTLKEFECGVPITQKSLVKNRHLFVIRDNFNRVVGFSGRYIDEDALKKYPIIPKWKHVGEKRHWVFPLKQSRDHIRSSREIIIVESIGDMLKLWDNGIKNCIVSFGLSLNVGVVSFLIRSVPNKIRICFNNDFHKNENTGQKYSKIFYKKLRRYFDKDQLEINMPTRKDFGEMTNREILEWRKNINV